MKVKVKVNERGNNLNLLRLRSQKVSLPTSEATDRTTNVRIVGVQRRVLSTSRKSYLIPLLSGLEI